LSAWPLRPLVLVGVAMWVAALPQVGWIQLLGQRWTLFLAGVVLVVMGLVRKEKPAGDPGPYQPGLASAAPARRISWRIVALLAIAALALRLITLGRPVAGEGGVFPGWGPDMIQSLSGHRSFLARLPVALVGAVTPPALYVLIRRTTGDSTALLAAVFLVLSPAHVLLSQSLSPEALAVLLFVASTLVLTLAVAHDRSVWWWLYGLLLTTTVLLGPWSLAVVVGHTLVMLFWSAGRRLAGYPGPSLRPFLVTAVLVCVFLALYLTTPETRAGPVRDVWWLPLGTEYGLAPVVVWALAALGLLALLGCRQPTPVYFLVAPAACVWFLQGVVTPYGQLTSLPWPLLPGVVVLASLGLATVGHGARALLSWIFPGRVSSSLLGQGALVASAVFLAWTVQAGLKSHFHRPDRLASRIPDGPGDHDRTTVPDTPPDSPDTAPRNG
jgi:dolichyl-phosphate-mannose-protein mannosyltransferase